MRKETILQTLETLTDPRTHKSLSQSPILGDILITDKRIHITLDVAKDDVQIYEPLCQKIEGLIKELPGAKGLKILVIMTAHKGQTSPLKEATPLDNITHIIAVASGKGGVGKSTTTVNLAYALHKKGLSIGILDADIYGPSIPKMMAVSGKPEADENNHMIPMEKDGIHLISMGLLMAEDIPVIWRGPIVQKAIQQFLNQVRWPKLDMLLLDMPPGTGDIQLTLVRKAKIAGAVIVSTPQDVALIDAKKAIGMFKTVGVPILGVIENMSYFECPKCSERSEIFAHGGAQKIAQDLDVPFLAEVPLTLKLREMTDNGDHKILASDGALSAPYDQAATALCSQLLVDSSTKGERVS